MGSVLNKYNTITLNTINLNKKKKEIFTNLKKNANNKSINYYISTLNYVGNIDIEKSNKCVKKAIINLIKKWHIIKQKIEKDV
jgi:hypothetical protein